MDNLNCNASWIESSQSVVIHSGNIVNWTQLKRKVTQTPPEEVEECLRETMLDCGKCGNCSNRDKYEKNLMCVHSQFVEKIPTEERDELKLTVKLILCDFSPPKEFVDAVYTVIKNLDTAFIETVLLAFPERRDSKEVTVDDIKPYWQAFEELVANETVLTLGVSDLNKAQLEELYDWAKVKPCINQVNLSTCCVMPEDLVQYAKDNQVQLLTHNDPKDLLPARAIRDIFSAYGSRDQVEKWSPVWAIRYTVLVKCRGIIKNKGYIAKASQS